MFDRPKKLQGIARDRSVALREPPASGNWQAASEMLKETT